MNCVSTAVVAIDRPARYGKQLVSHMGRKNGGEWDSDQGRGWINLRGHEAILETTESTLNFQITAPDEELAALQDALARHLISFAKNQELQIDWVRS